MNLARPPQESCPREHGASKKPLENRKRRKIRVDNRKVGLVERTRPSYRRRKEGLKRENWSQGPIIHDELFLKLGWSLY